MPGSFTLFVLDGGNDEHEFVGNLKYNLCIENIKYFTTTCLDIPKNQRKLHQKHIKVIYWLKL